MTTNSTTAEDRLAELGIHLPEAPTPFGTEHTKVADKASRCFEMSLAKRPFS